MIILKLFNELTLMKDILYRELPQSITVLGGVLQILHNNPCHLELCVDSWPTFSTAICYRQKQPLGGSSSSVFPDICTFFTKNPDALKAMLLDERAVNWRNGLTFRGIPSSHCSLIKDIASHNGLDIAEWGGYNTYIHHNPQSVTYQEKLLSLPISSLDLSHAELVDRHLSYGGSQESLNHVRACIRHLPNHCVVDDGGQPVSWILSDELCELRMAYTLPEYRRTGHLVALSVALIRSLSSMGLPVYCHVNQQNQATVNAVTTLGFSTCPTMEKISVLLICKDRV